MTVVPACGGGDGGDGGGGPIDAGIDAPLPRPDGGGGGGADLPPPRIGLTEEWKPASLTPLFQLTPVSEFDRFDIFNVQMTDDDFQTGQVRTSVETKMLEVGRDLGIERGSGEVDVFIDSENQIRAAAMPFRANPTDVKFGVVNDQRLAVVPLGGGVGDPGNQIAIVDLDNGNDVDQVKVGLHPQRVALLEDAGLAFVCNQYSNYISVVDLLDGELLRDQDNEPVVVQTEFYCTDLLLVERRIGVGRIDELFLYVANEFRGSVLKYQIDIIRDINNAPVDVLVTPPNESDAENVPLAEIDGVGKNPYRLQLNDAQTQIYVSNNRGGQFALFNINDNQVLRLTSLNAPTLDAVQINTHVFVATETPFRGLISSNSSSLPSVIDQDEREVRGLDDEPHVVHPGSLFDQTDSYNFEDLRDGIFQINNNLSGSPDYHTNEQEADAFFDEEQLVLRGSIPWDLERNAANNRLYAVMFGSDIVQEFIVVAGNGLRLQASGIEYNTAELPTAVALDEDNNLLMVVSYGGDFLELFNLAQGGDPLAQIDLGFAQPRYPATVVEAGEYFYSTAKWANDGSKACTTCHVDRLLTDGIGYANGATAPTSYHQVKPNYNLMETDNYFWNGSFVNNSYASLAFAAQSRTQCEMIAFALIEGPDSDPAQRVGDPVNFTSGADDINCRPNIDVLDDAGLPTSLEGDVNQDGILSFADIADTINDQKQIAFQQVGISVAEQIERVNGVFDANDGQNNRDFVSRAMDFYGAAELRLPPNPIAQMVQLSMLRPEEVNALNAGKNVFENVAECDVCHPANSVTPFADGRDHGAGGDFVDRFIREYDQDDRLLDLVAGGIPEQMTFTNKQSSSQEINYHYDPLDFFSPFCFTDDDNGCLEFNNPLSAGANSDEEDERLARIVLINLADPDRGFIPGQPNGEVRVNTPSLRGVWLQHNLLRHGLAFSFREAVLGPGHNLLRDGEKGWAIDRFNQFDVHGKTSGLDEAQMRALELYLQSIE
ncbi:YncE family protein [Haliangium ochraceum]|nr:hypothetical protein [Haliangium ochraceum]